MDESRVSFRLGGPPTGDLCGSEDVEHKEGDAQTGGTFSCFLVPPQTRLPPFLLGTKSDVISFFLPSASAANKRGGGGSFHSLWS